MSAILDPLYGIQKIPQYRVVRKSYSFQNVMSTILDPPFRKMEIRCQIRNQRPQKLWSTKLHENRSDSKILRPPYWIRHFEFRKSDVKFIIKFKITESL